MGSKYTSQAISGYNSTPPADDGSQSEANRVKWSTIKNKLTDPAKTLSEAINTAVNTALDYGPTSVVSTSITLGASHHNQFVDISGASAPTLASANGLGAGWFCDVKNTGASVLTMARANSTDTINMVTADVAVNPLDYIRFVVNAAANGFVTMGTMYATQAEVLAGNRSDAGVTPQSLQAPTYSDYSGGRIVYGPADTPSVGITVSSRITSNTWASVGPSGSGADHIFTDMDVLPTRARVLIAVAGLSVETFGSGVATLILRTRAVGSSASSTAEVARLTHQTGTTGHTAGASQTINAPLTSSNTFEVLWADGGSGNDTVTMRILGWIE